MTAPDAATAILYGDRARTALLQAKQYRAQAEAVVEVEDPDDLAGDVRRGVYRHLLAISDLYEALADSYRERAYSAQQIRRGVPVTVEGKPGDLARQRDTFVPRGLATCDHGCCPPAVCDFTADCPHARPYTEQEIAGFYQDGAA